MPDYIKGIVVICLIVLVVVGLVLWFNHDMGLAQETCNIFSSETGLDTFLLNTNCYVRINSENVFRVLSNQ